MPAQDGKKYYILLSISSSHVRYSDRRPEQPGSAVHNPDPLCPHLPFTHDPSGRPLPLEIHARIAVLLAVQDLKTFVRTCKEFNEIGSRLLYHSISATHSDGPQIFAALLLRYQPTSATHSRRPPACFVRCLSYVSTSADEDLRVFPLLADVLLRTTDLRHLHIDIHDRAVKALSAVLKRRGLARIPPSPIAAAFDSAIDRQKNTSCAFTLPQLRGLQLSSYKVLAELGKWRSLRAVILDESVSREEMTTVLDALTESGGGGTITAFSCVFNSLYGEGFLWAIAVAFPNLTFLGLVVPADIVSLFYDEAYHVLSVSCTVRRNFKSADRPLRCQLILTFFTHAPYIADGLEVLSIDFSWTACAAWAVFLEHVRWNRLQELLAAMKHVRPSLKRFFLTSAELAPEPGQGQWRIHNTHDGGDEGDKERRELATAGICRKP